MNTSGLRRVTVTGCGLIGTSVALALRGAGTEVLLDDHDPGALAEACARGAGRPLTCDAPPADVVVIATPPSTVVDTLYEAQARGLGRAYTDVASAKGRIWEEAQLRGCDTAGYIPGHPMAGREQSGPRAARADLFTGKPWILCPYPTADPDALAAVATLVRLCGARRTHLAPAAHDKAAAALSHAPHVVASALAAGLTGIAPDVLALSGTGLRDTTRVAGGASGLWRDILAHNNRAVADEIDRIAGELQHVAGQLRRGEQGAAAVEELLLRGNAGRAALLAATASTPGPVPLPSSGRPAVRVPRLERYAG